MIAVPVNAGSHDVPLIAGSEETIAAAATVKARSLEGYLELVCATNGDGRSHLARQAFRAPFHISKPYWNDHALVVQVVNPTAGLFAGDALRCEVRVESGARLHLTTPSASRIHTMRAGRAELKQKFLVARGAWLELQPSLLIPQKDCRYRQTTHIEVEEGGELYFVESFSPGRVAHGEWFQFSEIDWEFNLRWDNRLIARERFVLQSGDASLAALKNPFPHGYYASAFLITERVSTTDDCWRQIHDLHFRDVLVGASRLSAPGWVIKLLARDSPALAAALKEIRRILSAVLAPLQSDSRKP